MFAVCGEALFDVFATSETATGIALDARIGGSPFNVAVGLRRMGQTAGLVTRISRGFLGERLMRALQEEGVDLRLVQRGDESTTLSLVGLDSHGVPSYAFYGDGAADRKLDKTILEEWPLEVRCIHLGSYAAVVGQTARTQQALVDRESARCLISYDPNIRLNVMPDRDVWRRQIEWMLPRTHLLKVSEEDLQLLYGNRALEDFAQQALTAGVALVVVTRGAAGAQGWTADHMQQVEPVNVAVVDTVGAGDTFQCGLLTWLAEHDRLAPQALRSIGSAEMHAALRFAARAAAITCSRRGADLPRRQEIGDA